MENNYLVHHGIKGQRWGIRRFQNEDGSLTNAGKKRYSYREQDINKYETENVSYKKDIATRKSQLKDLNENGVNSKTWAKGYDNPDFDLGKDTYKDYGYKSENEGIDYLKKVSKDDIDIYQDFMDTNNDVIANIKNVPIYEKSYSERVRDGRRAAKAVLVAGSIGSVALSAVAGTALKDGKLATKMALYGIGAAGIASFETAVKGMEKANDYLNRYTESNRK